MSVTALDATLTRDDTPVLPYATPAEPPMREVRHEYSPGFPAILAGLGTSLLVSTYQAGKVVAVGVREGELTLSFHNFERAMGVAVRPGRPRRRLPRPGLVPRELPRAWSRRSSRPAATTPASCPARRTSPATSRSTSWPGPATSCGLVNTPFSCLCTLDAGHSFVPRWRPPFVSALAAEDRCHLNGLAMVDGQAEVRHRAGRDRHAAGLAAGTRRPAAA